MITLLSASLKYNPTTYSKHDLLAFFNIFDILLLSINFIPHLLLQILVAPLGLHT